LLFPNLTLDDLVGKDRSKLILLLSHNPAADGIVEAERLGVVSSPAVSGQPGDPHEEPEESAGGDFEQDRHWDEPAQNPATIATSDDINAIGLASDRHRRSYLGISSVSAILRALFRLCPGAKDCIIEESKLWPAVQQENRAFVQSPGFSIGPESYSLRELRYISFYFEHIHAITPFLDEETFMAAFAAGDRQTPAWLASAIWCSLWGRLPQVATLLTSTTIIRLARTWT
jgi:hypothetical protein